MTALRVIYHIAYADFLERTRRYSFLIVLGMVVWLGYASAAGILILRVPPNYVGQINSAWVGALMTLTATLFLGWLGFYLVKGSVGRDYATGVGQIMATTPLTRPLYVLGKWLSNFAVLSLMIFILMVAGILMNLLVGTAAFDLWAIIVPLFLVSLPCMALVAALAVLFESISWLRGGLGNVIYFFLFMLAILPSLSGPIYQPLLDFAGFRLIGDSIAAAAMTAFPESPGGFTFSISSALTDPQVFLFEGIAWTAQIILARFVIFLIGLGIAVLASVFFDRFNPAYAVTPIKKRKEKSAPPLVPVHDAAPVATAPLTPIANTRARSRFEAVFVAELKLLLKGQPWWWYAITAGLLIAQFANELEITRILLVITWLWPILLLSGLGNREMRHNTHQIVFSAPRPILNQLPAVWLAAFAIIAFMGSGALIRFLLAGEMISLLAWLGGALFIPSLALTFGVLTGSSKTFEVVYVIWMYIILNNVPALDFVGLAAESPWLLYVLLSPVLFVLSALARRRQLTAR